jgi:hypothetical protein
MDPDEGEQMIQNFHYQETINGIKTQFFSALDDFKKYYVYYNKNPEVDEFQNNYENSKSQLQNLSNKLLRISCSINENINKIDSDMTNVVKKLEFEKEANGKLINALNNLEKTQNGSEILIDDSKEKYNEQFYNNALMYFGILFILGFLAIMSGNSIILKLLKTIFLFTCIVLIYNISIMYSFLIFVILIAVLVGIYTFWKKEY